MQNKEIQKQAKNVHKNKIILKDNARQEELIFLCKT
jgi:hypothetical protein